MKIAIVGAAGSGKTSLAKKLATSLVKAQVLSVKPRIVDDYVARLERRTGWAYGHFAGYAQELQVMAERAVAEQEAARKGDTILCGTIFDTLCHAALHGQVATNKQAELAEFARVRATMSVLGVMIADTYDADYTFYLPYDIERSHTVGSGWDGVINAKLPEVMESYFLNYITLDQPERENVKFATKVIEEWEQEKHRAKATEVEQQAV